ncbi:MAG: ISL3 family transposase [Bacteroidales bacterium]|nr:ISL3 family transposase [Bacteroidales bacterium]
MNEKLLSMALGLQSPWFISKIEFIPAETGKLRGQIEISVDFKRGSKFPDSAGKLRSVHDTIERTWQHLDFFQHTCFIHARIPRIQTSNGNTIQVEVPWARPGSSFTLLFEAFGMILVENEMPFSKVGEVLGIDGRRVQNFFNYWVQDALHEQDLSNIQNIGIDETSSRKGHKYVTVVADQDSRRVIYVTEGKSSETIEQFAAHLENKGGSADNIRRASIDMSPAFINGIMEYLPYSEIVFDRFHIMKILNEAMDKTRRSEQKTHSEIKRSRYLWLKNDENLDEEQIELRNSLSEAYPTIGQSYRLKVLFKEIWSLTTLKGLKHFYRQWKEEVIKLNNQHFLDFTQTIERHWYGIESYIIQNLTNGLLEGINSKIQLAKRRARGYRNIENFKMMIYFLSGKLKYNYPQLNA